MKFCKGLKDVFKVIGLWLLNELKDLWLENLKDYLQEQLKQLVHDALEEITKLRDSVEYEMKRDEIYTKIFDSVKLPFWLKPFRTLLKHMLRDEIEERVSDTLLELRQKY